LSEYKRNVLVKDPGAGTINIVLVATTLFHHMILPDILAILRDDQACATAVVVLVVHSAAMVFVTYFYGDSAK
jgi:hypothetical protein